jgi:feruloyl esterase
VHFDPETLLCKGEENNSCLTAPQIAGLKKVYEGAKNPRTGEQIFPGYMRGGEAGWGLWIAGTQVPPRDYQHGIMVNTLANLVFDGFKWDWRTFDFDKDVAYADKKVGAEINQINPDLSGFKKHGAKMLQYHGWNDPALGELYARVHRPPPKSPPDHGRERNESPSVARRQSSCSAWIS